MMTRDEFINWYISSTKMDEEKANSFFSECEIIKCTCSDSNCRGWAMTPRREGV